MRWWPFSRKPKPQHIGPSSVDWVPGDMAECIFSPTDTRIPWPKVGDRMMVSSVGYGVSVPGGHTAFWLRFVGWSAVPFGYRSDCFRKIVLTETGADRKVSRKNPAPPRRIKETTDA